MARPVGDAANRKTGPASGADRRRGGGESRHQVPLPPLATHYMTRRLENGRRNVHGYLYMWKYFSSAECTLGSLAPSGDYIACWEPLRTVSPHPNGLHPNVIDHCE